MMVVTIKCPHCNTVAGFDIFGCSRMHKDSDGIFTLEEDVTIHTSVDFSLSGTCSQCGRPDLIFCHSAVNGYMRVVQCALDRENKASRIIMGDDLFTITETWPKPEPIEAPMYVPQEIASLFEDAEWAHRSQKFIMAITAFHTVLDTTLSDILERNKGLSESKKKKIRRMSITEKIEQLDKEHTITPSMKDWADSLRILGNDAIHRGDGDEEASRQAMLFADMLLRYLYTMPKEVELRRKGKKATSSQNP